MTRRIRTASRVAFLSVLLLSAAAVAQSFVAAGGTDGPTGTPTPDVPAAANESDATEQPSDGVGVDVESRFQAAMNGSVRGENWSAQRVRRASGDRGLTVVATQGFYVSDQRAELAAFTPNGTLVYHNATYRVYFDVDPVEDERYTVEYVAAKNLAGRQCADFETDECTRNVVARANLTTGEHEIVYAERTPSIGSSRWHDVDRLNETHVVIADIYEDSVRAVDTRDGSVAWRWKASENYTREQGGQDGDWTHLNDVELLDDGRVMVSLRNMDSVVFLNASNGEYVMDEEWTLGEDDEYDVLYEQHNPDYIPREMGGPSVIVADSENTRIVEYRRVDGEWTRTWHWRDVRLQWPRDADRLPNGNTLIVDTHGNRLVELGPDDGIEWAVGVGMPYDVERIGTGDESEGGTAAHLRDDPDLVPLTGSEGVNGTNGTVTDAADSDVAEDLTAIDRFWLEVKRLAPSLIVNGFLYASPAWVRFTDLAFTALFVLTGLTWGGTEFYWSRYSLRAVAARGRDALRGATARLDRRDA
ncbi:arylsulfotransferase family protein [Halomicrobium salinisoli]|uniref:arylsulfotransferase family protein n=1 Tax=Halomicrobium salinisoli TaxID=2878391 RepID=UPI001CF0A1E4|nr:arylsulfotransferase family protein [Halomicrobium salinisoli]